jgi:myo-inositol-1(or 4)-monophosphatase
MLKTDPTSASLLALCLSAAELGASIAQQRFLKNVVAATKSDSSVVTEVDVMIEQRLREFLAHTFDRFGFRGEETEALGAEMSAWWVVDPIDGTDNFVIGMPVFSTTVALSTAETCICGAIVSPMTGESFHADSSGKATLNGHQIQVPRLVRTNRTRIAFIPDYRSKRLVLVKNALTNLREISFRVIDSWSPALDWANLAAGRIDGLVQMASIAPTPNAGYLLADNAGAIRTTTVITATGQAAADELYITIAASDERLHQSLVDTVIPRQ